MLVCRGKARNRYFQIRRPRWCSGFVVMIFHAGLTPALARLGRSEPAENPRRGLIPEGTRLLAEKTESRVTMCECEVASVRLVIIRYPFALFFTEPRHTTDQKVTEYFLFMA